MGRGAALLLVGLDGATWAVAGPMIARGELPNLAALRRGGASGGLRSTTPPMTLPAWSSAITGTNPGKHGIFDFTARAPGGYSLRFTNATWRGVPTLFHLLSQRGARVASVAVPTTYPPEQVNGVVISGFDSPVATRIDGSHVHPEGLYRQLRDRFGGMAFADFQELRVGPGWHEAARAALLREVDRKERIVRWLMRQERWDALMVVFGETDTVAHHFWRFHDPHSPRAPASASPSLRGAVEAVYRRADQALGALIDEADAEVVVVLSDHGFGGASDRVLYLNRFLEAGGWLRYLRDSGGLRGHRVGSGAVDLAKGLALRHLPQRAVEGLVRRMPGALLGGIETRARYGDLDFPRTLAWSDEMNYAATLQLNLAGREPLGLATDRDAAIAEITEALLGWEVEGERVVAAVRRREALYHGPLVDRSADLVLELTEPGGYAWTLLPSGQARRGQLHRRLAPDELGGGKGLGMNGTHRSVGIWLQGGRGVAQGASVDLDLIDVLPTAFAAWGEAIPDHVDGLVRQGAFAEVIRPQWTFFQGALPQERALSPEAERQVRERLVSLGYL
ncbi:MAG: alkaline phosphatase family protein [Deltaproteobacteria bacterium]|nr:alkaline phosphatase family protein [Deltaproteobacteria bacterium]